MNIKSHKRLWLFLLLSLTMLSCKALASVPLPFTSLPDMEKNADAVIKILSGNDWYMLSAFAQEQYTPEEISKPGTLKYTVKIKNDKPIYFNYGWCAKTEEILTQNYQHIKVEMFFNGKQLGSDVVHTFTYNSSNGMFCGDYGVLFPKLPAGTYRVEAVATFDEKVNDGISDYDAGEYYYEYNVTVDDQATPQNGT